ncbi:MFS transporter [Leucobacter sp. UCMA 4100]|uniref:MFS transporter n=1 Tax=Leucobacter sp. UCMA 4100 TaxID=2810534 RepID=UPI0022EAB8B2|nr:MFS transporter [Leucobacter sp. UCMA 4100]
MTGPDSSKGFLRRYAPMIYGPSALFSMGEGAVVPVIPLIAIELGASLATAALAAAALVVGHLVGNLPAGWLVARRGERATMVISGSLASLGVLGMALSPSLALFMLAVFWVGVCAAAFSIARHAFMTTNVPVTHRARALSMLGGVYRFGVFVGPFIGAAAISLLGTNRAVCWWFLVALAATVLLVALGPDPEGRPLAAAGPGVPSAPAQRLEADRLGVFRTIADHREVLTRLGSAAACMAAVRAARQVVLPLWGESIGLQSSTILVVVGVSGALDFGLFYLSGEVMDRYGRLWAAVPALITMGVGFAVLSITHDAGGAATWFTACSMLVGVGNGLSSGILMTIGADLAPQGSPGPFLGAWHTITDGGSAATPVLFSALVAASSISVATGAIGLIALAGVLGFMRWVPRYVHGR